MAMRLRPKLKVLRRMPTNTRLRPFTVASRQPLPAVMRSPRRAFSPLIVIPVAMVISSLEVNRTPASIGIYRPAFVDINTGKGRIARRIVLLQDAVESVCGPRIVSDFSSSSLYVLFPSGKEIHVDKDL